MKKYRYYKCSYLLIDLFIHLKAILLKVEECKPKYQRSLRNLVSVAGHKTILLPDPITQCHDELKSNWEDLYEQV